MLILVGVEGIGAMVVIRLLHVALLLLGGCLF